MKIEVGSMPPDFNLYSSDKEKASLGDYKNENVVLFIFSAGCYRGLYEGRKQTKRFCN